MMEFKMDYEIGSRVIVNYRPYERPCPNCGDWPCSDTEPHKSEGTILAKVEEMTCSECGHMSSVEGFYGIYVDGRGRVGLPYTLLSPVEEDNG